MGTQTSSEKQSAPKKSKHDLLLRLWRYLYHYKWLLALAFLLTITGNLANLVGPMLSGYAIDAIHGPGNVEFDKVFHYAFLMILFYIFSAFLSYMLSRIMIRLSQNVVKKMRQDIFDHLVSLPVRFFDQTPAGEIISRISYDVDTLNGSLANDLLQIVTSTVIIFGSLAMMLSLAPKLVFVFIFTIPASLLLTKYMTTRVRPLFRKRSAKLGELNGYVEEMISGQKTIKVYHQEETMIERFDERNADALNAYFNADYYGTMTGPSVNLINNISLSLISVFGALFFLSGNITLGALSSFVLYSRKFSGPINEIANIVSELQSAFSAANRIFNLLDEEPEPADHENTLTLSELNGEVDLKHIRFGYNEGQTIIHDLSLNAKPGTLTAIVGPTGAGKTTIINLLMRFYDPQSGTLRLDGHEFTDITRKSLRLSYAMVLQDSWLFTGTIAENIAYGNPKATMDDVIRVCKAAYIHDAILQLPQGYDTVLTDEGSNLSKGQKQMLTIARAMLLDASLLILDEATSNVDTQTEQKIQAAMQKLMKGHTCFVIAHRLSTIQNADNILVVKNGDIVEQGTHKELLKKDGIYAGLYQAQFQ